MQVVLREESTVVLNAGGTSGGVDWPLMQVVLREELTVVFNAGGTS